MKFVTRLGDKSINLDFQEIAPKMTVAFDGEERHVEILKKNGHHIVFKLDGKIFDCFTLPSNGGAEVDFQGKTFVVKVDDAQRLDLLKRLPRVKKEQKVSEVHAAMPGVVLKMLVEPGDLVHKNDPMIIIEAMKMENEITAQVDAKIASVHVKAGETVDKNALLLTFE